MGGGFVDEDGYSYHVVVSGGARVLRCFLSRRDRRYLLRWTAESLVEAGPAGSRGLGRLSSRAWKTSTCSLNGQDDSCEREGRTGGGDPVRAAGRPRTPAGSVPVGFLQVMCRVAGIHDPEVLPIEESEPITLNVARQVRDYLVAHEVRSARVVTSGFRSERTFLIYRSVLEPGGSRSRSTRSFRRT